jgi:hypothetical protein
MIQPVAPETDPDWNGFVLMPDLCAHPIAIVEKQNARLKGLVPLCDHGLKLLETDIEVQVREVIAHQDSFRSVICFFEEGEKGRFNDLPAYQLVDDTQE